MKADLEKMVKWQLGKSFLNNFATPYEPENIEWITEQLQPIFDDYKKQYCDILFEQSKSNRDFLHKKEEMI